MRSASTALLALLLSMILLSTSLAQMGGSGMAGHDGRHGMERGDHAAHEDEWRNMSEAARARGLARAEEARLFARMNYTDGNASGRFVQFALAPATGVVRDFTVRANATSTTVFTSVTPTGFGGNGTPTVAGARLRLDGGNATFMAHNNPTALFQYRGENLTVTFQAPPNATLTQENGSVTVSVGALHGHVILAGNGTVTAEGSNVTATLAGSGGVLFAAHPSGQDPGVHVANLHALRDAVVANRLGGVLAVADAGGNTPATDETYLGVKMRVRDVSHGHANVTVDSDDPAGKAVVLLFDRAILGTGTLNVTLDGRAIVRAVDANAVLHARNASVASWHATNATGGVQILVNVPSFSEHVIGVAAQNASAGTTPTVTTPVGTTPAGTTPAGTTPAGTTPAGTTPSGTTPATGGTTATTPPTGEGDDNDAPGPGLALVALALAGAALVARRRRA